MSKLTCIIIAGNEQSVISNCLKYLSWADETILVAANSTDKTIELVKNRFPKTKIIIISDEYGKHFAKWRTVGLNAATSDWLLYVDADEIIPTDLKEEIQSTIMNPTIYNYFAIPRINYYLGKRVNNGQSYPDYQKRLFLKSSLKSWQGNPHEEPILINPRLGHLYKPFFHNTHRDLTSMTEKTIIWTDMGSDNLLKAKHPEVYWWRIPRMFFTTFFQRYFIQKMLLDGSVGFISSLFESFDTAIIYSKLWEKQYGSQT